MKTLIFAGTYREAEDWRKAERLARADVDFIVRAGALRGRATRGVPRVYVGTFWERPDATEIRHVLFFTDQSDPKR